MESQHWFTYWASYQIREIVASARAANAGNVFPATAG